MINSITVGAYWGTRKESRAECAARCYRFLHSISFESSLREWYGLQKRRRAGVGQPMEITEAAISKAFSTQFTDVGHKPIPELGYSLDKWNGNRDAGASLSVACGMYFESDVGFSNAAVLSLDCPAKFDIELYRQLLRASIEAWDPDNAGAFSIVSVDTDERVQKLEWLTYQRDEGIIKQGLPPPSDES